MVKKITSYFSALEIAIWLFSAFLILVFFALYGEGDYLTLTASLIGITSIMLNAKGNPLGQVLMIIFSLIYGYISFKVSYYGEMITYIGMTMPMSAAALISWLMHPFKGNRSQVEIRRLTGRDIALMIPLTVLVTAVFYFILKHFNTANIIPSTVSVTTSFLAVFLTFKRDPLFSLTYGRGWKSTSGHERYGLFLRASAFWAARVFINTTV